jgi:excinuclease ABC subunit B
MPEVSLVAILDADKEGFLRSEGSLIQTIGRAARNANGLAILYADRVTGSMQRAIAETERRRNRQVAYNLAHGIEPRTVRKAVKDVLEGARGEARPRERRRVAEAPADYGQLTLDQAARQLRKLEKRMHEHARNLEFEEAAALRDRIADLREKGLGIPPGSQRAG